MSSIIVPIPITPIPVDGAITVPYEDLGEPKWSVDRVTGQVKATRQLKCAWINKDMLVRELIGFMEVVGNNLYLHNPQPFPTSKLGYPYCVVQSTDVVCGPGNRIGSDKISLHTATYENVTVNVTYSTPDINKDIWRRETFRSFGEMVGFGATNLSFPKVGGKYPGVEEGVISRIIYGTEWTYSITQAGLPVSGFSDLVGCCNASSIRSPTFHRTFTRGTLIYIGTTISVTRDYAGNKMTEYTHTFHGRKEDWNKFPHPVAGQIVFDFVYNTKTDDKLISAPYENLHQLII
jgi:hypothetical protein